MKHTEFFKSLDSISPVYLFTGEEEYVLKSAVKKLEAAVVDEAVRSVNLSVFYENADAEAVCTVCETVPFMAEKRLVEVWESGFLSSAAKPRGEDRLCEYLENPCADTVLVFICKKPDKRKKAYKALQKHTVVEFDTLAQGELERWIAQVLRGGGLSIERDVLMFLEEYTDIRPESLINELEKLISFKAGSDGAVKKDDIIAIVTPSTEYNVFRLTDALLAKNTKTALSLLSGMLQNREEPIYLLGAISSQYRRMLRFKLLSGKSKGEIIKALGIRDFMYPKLDAAVKKMTADDLKTAVDKCIEADEGLKCGTSFPQAALHSLVIELCNL